MKKAINALIAVFATVAMAVAGFVGAGSALATENYNLSVSGTGHTYNIYQIFTGSPSDGKLIDVKWGQNGTGTVNTLVDDNTLTAITAISGTDQTKANALKTYADLTSSAFATVISGTAVSVPAGYYLVKDKDDSQKDKNDAYSTYIVKVVNSDVTVDPKSDVPSFKKELKDKNDTDGTTTGWQDSADYDFGDHIPFKLEGTVASNYDSYTKYYFAFHDKEEKGLTFDGAQTVHVYVDDKEIQTGYEVVTTGLPEGEIFVVKFADLKAIKDVKAGSEIRVEYTSTLNENANLGQQGNVNEARLQFSNNPNDSQGGETGPTGNTPWDNVIVFTYKVVVNKTDGSKPLAGAAFKLEKNYKNDGWKLVNKFAAGTDTTFEFKGLDDGEYKLSETETPAGYNTIQPITFTVDAGHKIEWTTEKRTDVLTSLSGSKASGEITFTPNESAGSLTANVINKLGSSLPETGGMGTIVLYVAGAALVVAAGAYFTLKKKYTR